MKIMLDAGHGFNTPGKRSPNGLKEYAFNRMAALFAKEELEDYQNVTVYSAHSDERDVPLQERTDAANRLNADVYVAIHANAYGTSWNEAGGIESYIYLSKPQEAYELASKIQNNLIRMTGLQNRGVKTADFHVLRESNMTAVLVECGFMTNRTEAGLMHTEQFQKACGKAIAQGLAEQYQLSSKQVSSPLPPAARLYKVQTGAFVDKRNAERLVSRMKAAGFEAFTTRDPLAASALYKVQSGAFADKRNAEALMQKLKNAGFPSFILL